MSTKGNNFCYFLFVSLEAEVLPKGDLLLLFKERTVSMKRSLHLRREVKKMVELLTLEVNTFTIYELSSAAPECRAFPVTREKKNSFLTHLLC